MSDGRDADESGSAQGDGQHHRDRWCRFCEEREEEYWEIQMHVRIASVDALSSSFETLHRLRVCVVCTAGHTCWSVGAVARRQTFEWHPALITFLRTRNCFDLCNLGSSLQAHARIGTTTSRMTSTRLHLRVQGGIRLRTKSRGLVLQTEKRIRR